MDVKIENIDLLLPKKVPKHGKVSGVKSNRSVVRVVIPKEETKLSLTVSEPSEVLVRNVTPDGKILGLTNYIGKTIYIIDQESENLEKETGMELFNLDGTADENKEFLNRISKLCEEQNIDFADLIHDAIKDFEEKQSKLKRKIRDENE